ncbi:START domain-containing protein 10 [Anabarilius grahami]|uniref:START domain-containing protein 10 n=1 Tax=Anabarilius grahami TaxID=495550 RepID=A0A3N0Z8Q9_ANAGA|nr:START domain-containing protein 10 [Anabarilius grahami]
MQCKDIPSETMYDVLHDIEYRRKWDANVIETFDIGKLTVNADVGYYSWKCPKPLKNRDVITLRSWLPMGNDYIIMNYSVKHAAMKRISKACLRYPEWKQKHSPGFKPWLFPEQNPLSSVPLSELSIQHADSLENIDESSLSESKDERAEHSDEEGNN